MSVFVVSNCLLTAAFVLLVMGVMSSTWRTERGYVYTLWERCDKHGCVHEVTGMNTYLALVRVGALLSLFCLAFSVSCIIVGHFTFMCRRVWQRKLINVSAVTAAFSLAPCLGLYGYKTVMQGHRANYPALGGGFALTAVAVMLNLGGSILRAMGPVRTWENGLSCLLPKDGLLLENRLYFKTTRGRYRSQHNRLPLPLFSVYHQHDRMGGAGGGANSYYAYASVVSSRSDILRRHSYEEIDTADMPAPPPELLDPPPPPPPPPCPAPRTTRDTVRSNVSTSSESQYATSEPPRRPRSKRKRKNCPSGSLQMKMYGTRHGTPPPTRLSPHDDRYHSMPSRAAMYR